MVLVRAPTQGRNVGSARQGTVLRGPAAPALLATQGKELTSPRALSPPLPHLISVDDFPPRDSFERLPRRSTPLSYSPLLVPWYLPTLEMGSVGQFLTLQGNSNGRLTDCVFCLHIIGNNCFLNVRSPTHPQKGH